jgi:hypothetical protein
LTADSKYNLERIDTLAGLIQTNTVNNTVIRALEDIVFLPNSSDIGGSGTGGTITFGSVHQPLDSFDLYTSSLSVSGPITLGDSASGGDKSLAITYKSDLQGLPDTAANRTLTLDVEGANRALVLGGDFKLLGGNLTLNLGSSVNWTLPSTPATPGQVLTNDGSETLYWSSSSSNSLGGMTDIQFTSPTSSDFLMYDSGTGKWINRKPYYTSTWVPADGQTKVITHSLGTTQVLVQAQDENGYQIDMGIQVTGLNTVSMLSSVIPTGNWKVFIYSLV